MVATALLLPVAFALLATDVSAASSLPAFSQRALRTSTTGGFGSNDDFVSMTDYEAWATYKSCEDRAPSVLSIMKTCMVEEFVDDCAADNTTGESTNAYSTVTSCVSDVDTIVDQLFGNETYMRYDAFGDTECTSWAATVVFLVTGKCLEQMGYDQVKGDTSFLPVLNANGSASWASYHGDDCSGLYGTIDAFWIDAEDLSSNSCVGQMKWYANAAASNTTEDSAGSTGSAGSSGSSNTAPRSFGVKTSGVVIASVAIFSAALAFAI
jgi:hypothetical protein